MDVFSSSLILYPNGVQIKSKHFLWNCSGKFIFVDADGLILQHQGINSHKYKIHASRSY